MNARKCDRCGKFYEQYNNQPSGDEQPNKIAFVREYGVHIHNEAKLCSFDLCEQCMDRVKKWMIQPTDLEVIEE